MDFWSCVRESVSGEAQHSLTARASLKVIGLYQSISRYTPAVCRFTPSCSEYTRQAIEKYGFVKGSWMGVKRICRCHPFHRGGHDPVT